MSKEECCMCSDRLNYVKLCEKYDQLESVHKVLVEDNLTYENQIADLEAKLAEKEDRINWLVEAEFNRKWANKYVEMRRKEDPKLLFPDSDEVYQRYFEQKDEIAELKQQLAEKEKENELMAKTLRMTKYIEKEINQDKISFCIEKLYTVRCFVEDIDFNYGDDKRIDRFAVMNEIDDIIEQLKESE